MKRILLALACLAAQASEAQAPDADPRVRTIAYRADQVVRIAATPGYQVTVALGDDERIESVALGDSAAWSVTADKRANHLFVKPLQNGVVTNMTVVTDARLYAFELVPASAPGSDVPFAIRFVFPATNPAATPTAGRYTLGGDRALRPSGIDDDGTHTYIQWPEGVTLPAIYAVDADGRETLVAGNVRDGLVVVDSVAPRYAFRRDAHVARATRIK